MKKKNNSRFYFVTGTIWFVTGIINIIISENYFFLKTSLGITYICLAMGCLCFATAYMSMGTKKKK